MSDASLVNAIVEMNGSRKSWRERLQWVRDQFTDAAFAPTANDLAALAVYLRFLSTGEIRCEEDGRHFRPNHHAEAAQQIEAALDRVTNPETAWVIRRIYPLLPSWGEEFRRAEPLTRIRDIAHRNDIPHDLKRDIKSRLQNKLHRCAGPEDLRTSAEFLKQITAPGTQYSADFVREFRVFHAELEEFFNATGLDRRLRALADGRGPVAEAAKALLTSRTETKPAPEQLAKLTALRRAITEEMTGADVRRRSLLRLADIGLEDFAFRLLSDWANREEVSLNCIALALENLRLSGIDPGEADCLRSEFDAWANGSPDQTFQWLRVLASLDRARRLAESYTDRINAAFPPLAQAIGQPLGVAEHAIRVFAEGAVRGHVVFQLSRLVERGLTVAREALHLPPWEAIVPGEVTGTLRRFNDLSDAEKESGPLVLLLNQADGDAEVPASVRGILLGHPIPHLSHLGVRARQARTAFATAASPEYLATFDSLVGKSVRLQVRPDGPTLTEAAPVAENAGSSDRPTITVPEVVLAEKACMVPLEEATPTTCGAKAAGARRLLEVAAPSAGLFRAPRGLAIPFGVMERVLAMAPERSQEYHRLRESLHDQPAERDAILDRLRDLVGKLPVPDEVAAALVNTFGADTRLAVRSSANGEDLENLAGAGLYDSVIGVTAKTVAAAVAQVWASLWTRRATVSREQAGIAHDRIYMAVLVQELVDPYVSFIMHTVNPVTGDRAEAVVELAVGLGETLASAAQPGTPYRLICPRTGGNARLASCATFSLALRPGRSERLDYSHVRLSTDVDHGRQLGHRLADVASRIEEAFGGPQDVEGVLAGDTIWLVQARPQQGL
jgi:phosphoglucan,water dikinase